MHFIPWTEHTIYQCVDKQKKTYRIMIPKTTLTSLSKLLHTFLHLWLATSIFHKEPCIYLGFVISCLFFSVLWSYSIRRAVVAYLCYVHLDCYVFSNLCGFYPLFKDSSLWCLELWTTLQLSLPYCYYLCLYLGKLSCDVFFNFAVAFKLSKRLSGWWPLS